MKYTKEQRLDIGRRIYDGELTRYEAAEEYEISDETARNYMRQYRNANQLPPKRVLWSSVFVTRVSNQLMSNISLRMVYDIRYKNAVVRL